MYKPKTFFLSTSIRERLKRKISNKQTLKYILQLSELRTFYCDFDTLAEWLTRQPRKLVPSGAQVRILQVSLFLFFAFLFSFSNSSHVLQRIIHMWSVRGSLLPWNKPMNNG